MRIEPTASQVEDLAQGVAAPGESWAVARVWAVRLLTEVSTCRPCPCCDPEELARYRLPLGLIEGDGEMCRGCRYDEDSHYDHHPGADYTLPVRLMSVKASTVSRFSGSPASWSTVTTHNELLTEIPLPISPPMSRAFAVPRRGFRASPVHCDRRYAMTISTQADSPERSPTADEAAGMVWWNCISDVERGQWLTASGTGVVADAWAARKAAQVHEPADAAVYHNQLFWFDELAKRHRAVDAAPDDANANASLQHVEALLQLEESERHMPLRAWHIGDDYVVVARSVDQALAVVEAEGAELPGGWADPRLVEEHMPATSSLRRMSFEDAPDVLLTFAEMLPRFQFPRIIWACPFDNTWTAPNYDE